MAHSLAHGPWTALIDSGQRRPGYEQLKEGLSEGRWTAHESEHRSDRVRRAIDQNAERGIGHGGPGYGWNRDDTLNTAEARIVAELTDV
jgi:hypothetical protein